MQKVMIEYNLAHPRLIEIIERQLVFNSIIEYVGDICQIVSVGMKDASFFSDQLYDSLFNKSLKLMP